jgi:hypothetical protein
VRYEAHRFPVISDELDVVTEQAAAAFTREVVSLLAGHGGKYDGRAAFLRERGDDRRIQTGDPSRVRPGAGASRPAHLPIPEQHGRRRPFPRTPLTSRPRPC